MNHLPRILNSGAHSIDGVTILDGANSPRSSPRVSRTATVGRRTLPAQFHRSNPNPLPPQRVSRTAAVPRRTWPLDQLMAELHLDGPTALLTPRQRRLRLLLVFRARSHNETEAAVAASVEEYQIRTTGASESSIANLERVEIGWKRDDCCTICLEEMGSGEGKAIKLDCRHVYHENCLVSWLRASNCCPLCRFRIQDS
ncbi:E3 ubiquitin-protein ligase RDUF1 [Linum grandiflorum]